MNARPSLRTLLSVIVVTGLFAMPRAFATGEGAVTPTEAQTTRMSSAETLLNFKIEAPAKRTPPDCAAAKKLEQDRRKLDPQLSASDKRKYLDPISPDPCKEVESIVPMKR